MNGKAALRKQPSVRRNIERGTSSNASHTIRMDQRLPGPLAFMELILELTLPFFAVAGLGYLAAWRGMLGDNAVRSLNVFVFYFATPALLVRAVGSQNFADILNPSFLGGYLAASLIMFGCGAILARLLFGVTLGEMAVSGQAAAVPNLGFLGLPLAIAAFGTVAAGPFAMAMIVDLVVIIPLSIALLEIHTGGGGSAGLRKVVYGVIFNPFLLSIAAGLALSYSGLSLALPADRFLEFLSGAAGPAALFALGASLADRRVAGSGGTIALMTGLKLVVHPLLVWAILGLWLDVRADWLIVAITFASIPIAGNVFVIAQNYGQAVQRVSTAILLSTAIGCVTVAVAMQLAGK